VFCRSQSKCVLNAGSGETVPDPWAPPCIGQRPRQRNYSAHHEQLVERVGFRVRTRVTTVTRLEAMYSHPIEGPTNITSFRSGNPRPRPDLRLTSLNRNNGLGCWSARGLSYRPIHGNPCAGGPFRTRLHGQNSRRSCRCIFAEIAWDGAPISEDLRKSNGECRGNFFLCARKARLIPSIRRTNRRARCLSFDPHVRPLVIAHRIIG
jgi:hypothetical protein